MDWSDHLNRLCDEGRENLGDVCRAVKIELFSGVVLDTRVDTGRLRGNWQISEKSPALGDIDTTDRSGSKTINEITQYASPDGVTYLVNNLPYAAVWEERDAMVGRNIARIEQNLIEQVKKL